MLGRNTSDARRTIVAILAAVLRQPVHVTFGDYPMLTAITGSDVQSADAPTYYLSISPLDEEELSRMRVDELRGALAGFVLTHQATP